MRLLLPLILLLSFLSSGFSQTVFWTEDFEGSPCNSGCDPSLISWTTTNTGTNSGSPNVWYVSCAENGQAAGGCGAGCGNDESLHVGSTTLGDIGAAYDASQTTSKRIASPTINCTGNTGITVNFNYIMNGEVGVDEASFLYFDGSTWNTITSPLAITSCCGGPCNGLNQAQWTAFSVNLPVSANNNPNVQIGFNWTNDGSSGNDPSFAVDDITVSYQTGLPIELIYFSGKKTPHGNFLEWSTQSEINNDYFTIERSDDAIGFYEIGQINGGGNSNNVLNYEFIDDTPGNSINYYRLKQTDFDEAFSYSNIIALKNDFSANIYYNNSTNELIIDGNEANEIAIYSMQGQLIQSFVSPGNKKSIDLPNGMYLVKATKANETYTQKIMIIN